MTGLVNVRGKGGGRLRIVQVGFLCFHKMHAADLDGSWAYLWLHRCTDTDTTAATDTFADAAVLVCVSACVFDILAACCCVCLSCTGNLQLLVTTIQICLWHEHFMNNFTHRNKQTHTHIIHSMPIVSQICCIFA